MKLFHLGGEDRSAAAAEHLNVGAAFGEQLDHVLEVLDVPALVRRERDAMGVLLDRAVHDLCNGTVVP